MEAKRPGQINTVIMATKANLYWDIKSFCNGNKFF
jgi:hypothetical protein